MFAGGRAAAIGGRAGRLVFPVALLSVPLIGLAPVAALVLSLLGVLGTSWLLWSALSVAATLVFWMAIYHFMRASIAHALLYPLGLVMFGYIALGSVLRGQRVEWKNREYLSS
jgi:hypothetical protein